MTRMASFRSYLYNKPIFFNLFDEAMSSIVQASSLLVDMVSEKNYDKKKDIYMHINKHKLDVKSSVDALFSELQKNFITPYDRDDIFSITIFLKKIADNINAYAKKNLVNQTEFENFNFNPSDLLKNFNVVCEDLKTILISIRDQDSLYTLIEPLKNAKQKIGKIEDEIEIYSATLLNDATTSAKDIIKVIEVFKNLAKALDGCEKEIFVIESIVVKYQ
jgi:uncharacterized protein